LLISETYGVKGVPTFVIGGALLYGVQESAALTQAIELVRNGQPISPNAPQPSLPIGIRGVQR
jgi:predicted DsbA family dithiol-disulfide isomerase